MKKLSPQHFKLMFENNFLLTKEVEELNSFNN